VDSGARSCRAIPTCVGTTRKARPPGGVPAGHPHVCGDYGLGRGELFNRKRAIPTCVGTTPAFPGPPGSGPGHPHVRGDYVLPGAVAGVGLGPSPRAWGLRGSNVSGTVRAWAIPTCVGTTRLKCVGHRPSLGHPHVRGDYAAQMCRAPSELGPSPRAWGLRGSNVSGTVRAWAIPTCVGTTASSGSRVRPGLGPSPRAWGLLGPHRRHGGRGRAIPTCVGTTLTSSSVSAASGPSPRAWGLLPKLRFCSATSGPSPRAWGLLVRRCAVGCTGRAIPTCVGTTGLLLQRVQQVRAIPTCVGTTRYSRRTPASLDGPSPRAWGLHMTQTAKTPADPPLCVCKGNHSKNWLSRSPCAN